MEAKSDSLDSYSYSSSSCVNFAFFFVAKSFCNEENITINFKNFANIKDTLKDRIETLESIKSGGRAEKLDEENNRKEKRER